MDDKNASVTYSPAWSNWNDARDYNGSESYIKSANSYVEYSFNGTGIRSLGMTQPNMGKIDVYIDGVLAQAGIDAYAPTVSKQVVLYQNTNLANGSHTIKVVCTGTKNASSSNTTCAVGFASISTPDQTAYYKLVNKNSGKEVPSIPARILFNGTTPMASISVGKWSKQPAATTKSLINAAA